MYVLNCNYYVFLERVGIKLLMNIWCHTLKLFSQFWRSLLSPTYSEPFRAECTESERTLHGLARTHGLPTWHRSPQNGCLVIRAVRAESESKCSESADCARNCPSRKSICSD